MKKTYISPDMLATVVVAAGQLLKASIKVVDNEADIEVSEAEEYNDVFHARRDRDLWYDEEDEEQ